jgi:hypothetical protein
MESGLTRDQAERTARIEFGNIVAIEERSREVWQWPRLESIASDLFFALRQFRKAPGFAMTAIFVLAYFPKQALVYRVNSGIQVFFVGATIKLLPLGFHQTICMKNRTAFMVIGIFAQFQSDPYFAPLLFETIK